MVDTNQLFQRMVERLRERHRAGDWRIRSIRRQGTRAVVEVQPTPDSPVTTKVFDLTTLERMLTEPPPSEA